MIFNFEKKNRYLENEAIGRENSGMIEGVGN